MKFLENSIYIFAVILGVFAGIDGLSSSIDFLTFEISVISSIVILLFWISLKITSKKRLLKIKLDNGKKLTAVGYSKKIDFFVYGSLLALWIPILIKSIQSENKVTETPSFSNTAIFNDTTKFNLLLLPLHPDKECDVIQTNFEYQLIERYQELMVKEKSNFEFKFFELGKCPITSQEAFEIAKKKGADLIIWGNYEEECNLPDKIRIRYVSLIDVVTPSLITGDTDSQELSSLSLLRKGYLQKDIDFIIYSSLGMFELSSGNYNKSIFYFEKIENSNECDVISFFKAQALFMQGKTNESEVLYNNNIKCNDIHLKALAHFNLGIINYNRRDLKKAKKHLEISIDLGENKGESYRLLGDIFFGEEDYNKASDFFKLSLSENYISESLLTNLGYCFVEIQEYDKALKTFELQREQYGINTKSNYRIAQVYFLKKNYNEALVYLTKTIEKDSSDFEAFYYRGICYEMLGKNILSWNDYMSAYLINPEEERIKELFRNSIKK